MSNLEKMTREELGEQLFGTGKPRAVCYGAQEIAAESLRRLGECEVKREELRGSVTAAVAAGAYLQRKYEAETKRGTAAVKTICERTAERNRWQARFEEGEEDVAEIAEKNDKLEAKLATAIADRGVLAVKLWKAENPEVGFCPRCGARSLLEHNENGWRGRCAKCRHVGLWRSTIPLAVEAWAGENQEEKNDETEG